jgi:heme/copper-type cytochrome/quinol oxidase subunit 4
MIETIIRYIVIMIVLSVIGEVITHLSSKTIDENISTTHYRVKAPAVLKYACMSQFILGMIMFLIFSYFYLKGNETVEMGHLYFSSIFGAIGLYGVAWGVLVNDSQLEIHRIFHVKKVLCITDIGQVIIDKKEAMILYDKMGKKLIKIDALSDNYDHLLNLLKSQNIEISNKHLK